VPELIKKMYDYRMSIENMRAEVTVTYPVDTKQIHREKMKQHHYFAYNKGRVRCDITYFGIEPSHVWLHQKLSTPDFYFTRYPSGVSNGVSTVNDGNGLFLGSPLIEPFALDPRRIGTDRNSFDAISTVPFHYDSLLDWFYPARAENFDISIDWVDGEKLYKVSYQFDDTKLSNSYWINPQKGYNLIRSEAESDMLNMHSSYIVTLDTFATHKGDVWFPREISYKYSTKDCALEEIITIDSIDFDIQDETPFTLAGLGIPVGYCVYDRGERKYWDGKELVDEIPFTIEPVNIKNRKVLLIVYAVIFTFLALWFLYKLLQRRSN